MMGNIARKMMQRVIKIAGNDATAEATISLLTGTVYDTHTGVMTRTDVPVKLGRAIVGVVSDADVAKFGLQSTTHKAVVAMLDYEASGSPKLPKAQDRILLNDKPWLLNKVVVGSLNQSLVFFVSEAKSP